MFFQQRERLFHFLGASVCRWFALTLIGALLLSFVELAIAAFLQCFLISIDMTPPNYKPSGISNMIAHTPGYMLLVLCIICIARFVGQYLVAQGSVEIYEKMNSRLKCNLINKILFLDPEDKLSSSKVSYYLSEIFPKSSLFLLHSNQVIAFSLQSGALFIIMALVAWKETLLAIVGLSLLGVLIFSFGKKVRALGAKLPAEQKKVTQGLERIIKNKILIRILETQSHEHEKMSLYIGRYTGYALLSSRWSSLASCITPSLGLVLLSSIVILSQKYIHTTSISLLSFLYLFVRFVQSLSAGVTAYGNTNQVAPHFKASSLFLKNFHEDFTAFEANKQYNQQKENCLQPPTIDIKKIDFWYQKDKGCVLQDFSSKIPAGSQVGIIGPSGCGKSTLLKLVLGIIYPQTGEILLNDQPIKSFFDRYKITTGYVGSEPFLFEGTLKENLLYGNKESISDSEIRSILNKLNLQSLLPEQKDPLSLEITESGSNFSAGQRQRICLARALLAKPSLLVLDEFTANLDVQIEAEIVELIHELKKTATTLIVSHRMSAIKHADQVIDMGLHLPPPSHLI